MIYHIWVDGDVTVAYLHGVDPVSVVAVGEQTLLACSVPDPGALADVIAALTDQGLRVSRAQRVADVRQF